MPPVVVYATRLNGVRSSLSNLCDWIRRCVPTCCCTRQPPCKYDAYFGDFTEICERVAGCFWRGRCGSAMGDEGCVQTIVTYANRFSSVVIFTYVRNEVLQVGTNRLFAIASSWIPWFARLWALVFLSLCGCCATSQVSNIHRGLVKLFRTGIQH